MIPDSLFVSLLKIRGLVCFRLCFFRIWFPRGRIRRRGRVHAEVPHIQVHSFFPQDLRDSVFAPCQRFGGRDLHPASGHGGDRGRDKTFVGFRLPSNCDLDCAGNALATHDVEAALLGTSLGVNLESGLPIESGHEHHMRAINRVRAAGSIKALVDSGELKSGVMKACIDHGVPFVLGGSVRDDGPLPEVITDVVEAQDAMRELLPGVRIALMLSTMLHSIATGNLLPASVRTVCVDMNPAVVTKLADRGSWQSIGLVTDVESFLRELVGFLE